jgi:hypothetical protein
MTHIHLFISVNNDDSGRTKKALYMVDDTCEEGEKYQIDKHNIMATDLSGL